VREPGPQPRAFALGETPEVLLGLRFVQALDLLFRWGANHCKDLVEHVRLALRVELRVPLVLVVRRQREARGPREQRPSVHQVRPLQHPQQLGIDATHRPYIDGVGVVFLQQDQLRGTVPPRDDVPRQVFLQALGVGHLWHQLALVLL